MNISKGLPPVPQGGDAYEYSNCSKDKPNGPFTLEEMAELRCRGYFSPASHVRINGGEWKRASEYGIPISYPKAEYAAAWALILLLLAVYCFLPSPNPPFDLHTVNGLPNIWTFAVDGQWWRIFTGTFTCTGILSLCTAACLILFMGACVIPFLGSIGFLLLYMLCGIGGSLALLAANVPSLETSYGLCHLPVSGVIPGCYGLMGAAIALGGWRPCRLGTVWSCGLMIMLATFLACMVFPLILSRLAHADFMMAATGFLLGILLVQPCRMLYLHRQKISVNPSEMLMIPSRNSRRICLAAVGILGCCALSNYLIKGSESAILDEERAYSADDEQAAELLVRAASKGFPYACEAAAYCHMDRAPIILRNKSFNLLYNPQRWQKPRNRQQNPEQAAFWMEKAARHGFPQAQYETGKNYMNGFGVDKDTAQAVYWLGLAARQRHNLWYRDISATSLPHWLKKGTALLPGLLDNLSLHACRKSEAVRNGGTPETDRDF